MHSIGNQTRLPLRTLALISCGVGIIELLPRAVMAQSPPQPTLIRRFEFPNDPELHNILEMVNVGDRGSMLKINGNWSTISGKDGFDEFAILFYDRLNPGAKVWVYDGRTGERLRDPTGALLEYAFADSSFDHRTGMNGDGGKDLDHDGWPDLVIGAPTAPPLNALGVPGGALYVLSMKTPSASNVRTITPPDAANDFVFGASVAVLGDFAGAGTSAELVVGCPGHVQYYHGTSGQYNGRVYVLDLDTNPPTVLATVDAPDGPFGNPTLNAVPDFGFEVSLIGPIASKSSGADVWSDTLDRTPEFAVSSMLATPGPAYSFNGMIGIMNAYGVGTSTPSVTPIGPPPSSGGPWYLGPHSTSHFGYFLAAGGDVDAGAMAGAQSPSWDLRVAQMLDISNAFPGPFEPEHTYLTDPNSITAFLPSVALANSNKLLHPGFGDNIPEEGNECADQMAAVGDMDLDGGPTNGHDDYAWVQAVPVSSTVCYHEVPVVSGTSSTGNEVDAYLLTMDPVTNKLLRGTAKEVTGSNYPYIFYGGRTSVSRLGDVDGNGIDDFGVISGYDDDFGNRKALALVLTGNRIPSGDPNKGLTYPSPILIGNYVAQRGSRIAITVAGCRPLANGVLWEDVTVTSVSQCGSTRTVGGTPHPFTCNQMGEFHYVRDLNYYTTTTSELPGAIWYYQATVQVPGGCVLTNVRTVSVIDSSNPLDCYPGDS